MRQCKFRRVPKALSYEDELSDQAFYATSDTDRDGHSALAEFQTHTDPNDPQSVLRFIEARPGPVPTQPPNPRTTYFMWSYVPGTMYQVETSTDLFQWRNVPGPYFATGTLDGRSALYLEIQAQSATSFYRVRVKEDPFE